MVIKYRNITILLLVILTNSSYARPVSYPGGITVIQNNNYVANSLWVHYSPTPKDSIGARIDYLREDKLELYTTQYTRLVKRWNKEDSQANLYFMVGVGGADTNSNFKFSSWTGISTDWETRRWFLGYKNRYTYIKDTNKIFYQSARVGFAPIESSYEDLQPWLMLQAEYTDHKTNSKLKQRRKKAEKLVISPILRLFKGEYLTEVGYSSEGTVLFNWIIRF